MVKTALTIIFAVATAGLVAAYFTMPPKAPGLAWIDPHDQDLVAAGQPIYAEACAECHGDKLQGETGDWRMRKENGTLPAPPHDETGHTWHHADQILFDYTKLGGAGIAPPGFKSGMPPFEGILSDREIVAVLAFIKSTWPAEQRRHQKKVDDLQRASSG